MVAYFATSEIRKTIAISFWLSSSLVANYIADRFILLLFLFYTQSKILSIIGIGEKLGLLFFAISLELR